MILLNSLREKIKTWLRGDVRVPGGRGRVYARRNPIPPDHKVKVKAEGHVRARVYRAKTGKWEDLGEIASSRKE